MTYVAVAVADLDTVTMVSTGAVAFEAELDLVVIVVTALPVIVHYDNYSIIIWHTLVCLASLIRTQPICHQNNYLLPHRLPQPLQQY